MYLVTPPPAADSPTPNDAASVRRQAQHLPHCLACGRPAGDPLTGLADRWAWWEEAHAILVRAGRQDVPVSLLLADLDAFKQVNDVYGHLAGDAVLVAVADSLRQVTHGHDLLGRYGGQHGDEFLLLLPRSDVREGVHVARRLTQCVAALAVPVRTPEGPACIAKLSISVGVASWAGQDLAALLIDAEAALMKAKRTGGGQIRVTSFDE